MPDVTVNTAPYVEYYNGLTIAGNYGLLKILREHPLAGSCHDTPAMLQFCIA
jgi:hypothetical protein